MLLYNQKRSFASRNAICDCHACKAFTVGKCIFSDFRKAVGDCHAYKSHKDDHVQQLFAITITDMALAEMPLIIARSFVPYH